MRKSTISDYENDVIDIKISVLREIAAALHVYPDYFLKGDDLNPKIRDAVFALSSITDERLLQAALPSMTYDRDMVTKKDNTKGSWIYRIYAFVLLILICFAVWWGLFSIEI